MTTGQLNPIANDLWSAEDLLAHAGGAICFALRMTVFRLPDGSLVLWSPIPIDDGLQAELEAIGPVRHLVAPNSFHHLYMEAAHRRFPDASVWLSPALADKRPDLWRIGQPLTDTGHSDTGAPHRGDPWQGALTLLTLQGMPRVQEVVAFHPASRSLVVTDLVFNEHRPQGWLTPLVLRMTGAYKRVAQSRLLRWVTTDKAAAAASYGTLLSWPFERLVLVHGDLVLAGAKPALAAALAEANPMLAATASSPVGAAQPR